MIYLAQSHDIGTLQCEEYENMCEHNELIKYLKTVRGSYLVRNEKQRDIDSSGLASITYDFLNRNDTKYGVASMGKIFTAVGILLLRDAGKLSLDDPIGMYLDFDAEAIDARTTIKSLLIHQSTVPDYFDEEVMDDYAELWQTVPNYTIRTSADLLPLFIHKEARDAEAGFAYNNSGYVLLGLILEAITKQTFSDFIQEQVFMPCEMHDSGYYELDRLPYNTAAAYIKIAEETYISNIYSIDVKGTGAGGVFTTVEDMERFWDALFAGKVLAEKTVQEMIEPHSREDDIDYYGYGVWLRKQGDVYIPYLQGFDPGISCLSIYNPKTQAQVTVISNFDDYLGDVFPEAFKFVL